MTVGSQLKSFLKQYTELSGEKPTKISSVFDDNLIQIQEKILEKGKIFGLELLTPEAFNAQKLVKEKLEGVRSFKKKETKRKQALFFGYKVRFDVEALTVALEEYIPIVCKVDSKTKWEVLENKIFDIENKSLSDLVTLPKSTLEELARVSQRLLELRTKHPAGTIEGIINKIQEDIEQARRRKVEDIEEYDRQKRDEIQQEIDEIERKVKEAVAKNERNKKTGRSLAKIEELQNEIVRLERRRKRLEDSQIIKLKKLDELKEELIFKVGKSCELVIDCKFAQIGLVDYESVLGEVTIDSQTRQVEIIPATGEVILPEEIEKFKPEEPEFEVLPRETKPVFPSERKYEWLRPDYRFLLFLIIVLVVAVLVFLKPSVFAWTLGVLTIAFTALVLVGAIFKRQQKRLLRLEKIQTTMVEVDKMSWREFEEFIANLFEKMGYKVTRIGGWGGDFGADLIAIDPTAGIRYAVQAKKWTRFKVNTSAVKDVLLAWSVYDVDAGIVVTNNYFTERAGILPVKIKKLRVDLWDRDILREKMKSVLVS